MIKILEANPLLLLFLVAAIGYWLGQIRFRGSSLGVAAVLFVGLFFGALDPNLAIPNHFLNLGLVLFVYTIGLSNGPGFFAKFRREGMREVLFIIGIMLLPAFLLLGLSVAFSLSPASTTGIFTGLSNNTPALASVLDYLNTQAGAVTAVSQAVVGFSVVYPMGVLARMLVLAFAQRLWHVDFAAEAYSLRKQYPIAQDLAYRTITVTQPEVIDTPLRQLQRQHEFDVVFGRIYRPDEINLMSGSTLFRLGDQILIAGTQEDMDHVEAVFGQKAEQDLLHDKAVYDSRRLFVSNPAIAGKPLAALNLKETHGALVSHVRRGDTELLANDRTVLELGDRIRVLAPREEIPELVTLFGDSYNTVSEVNLLTLGLGITLGLLVGLIPIPLPGGVKFSLGLAGGPLLVALILSALRRTGPLLWTLPYSANLTLRQIGLILLLAAIGVGSGSDMLTALTSGAGWLIFLLGTLLIIFTTFVSLAIGYKLLKIPYGLLIGMISPQPAVLGFALEQAQNPLPSIGYTLMFPFSIIINVSVAQILLITLQNWRL
ncbi:MAG: transporter [Ardenticatenaceae bacterium]|nr:transporter [Ardenticatenaceae bacterium]